jgi:hypothetical protein
MASSLESTDARNRLEDLSGAEIKPSENPYEALIKACHGRPVSLLFSSLTFGNKQPTWVERFKGGKRQREAQQCLMPKNNGRKINIKQDMMKWQF